METKNLAEKSIIVSLSISMWRGKKEDRKVTAEVEQMHGAKNAGNYRKHLIAEEYMKPLLQAEREAREAHRKNTLAWGDNGDRLLPSENFFDYMGEMASIKMRYDEEVEKFITNYPRYVQESEQRLGTMYNPMDYPLPGHIGSCFQFKTHKLPVPETDFRVTNLAEADLQDLRKDVEREIGDRLHGAMDDLKERIKSLIAKVKENSQPEARVYTSTFEQLKELVHMVPKLNVTKDKEINDICEEMKKLVVDADELRNNEGLKAQKAREVEELTKKYSGFFS